MQSQTSFSTLQVQANLASSIQHDDDHDDGYNQEENEDGDGDGGEDDDGDHDEDDEYGAGQSEPSIGINCTLFPVSCLFFAKALCFAKTVYLR